jgi:hypothetical protein
MARIEVWKDGLWAPDREEFGALVSDFESFAGNRDVELTEADHGRRGCRARRRRPGGEGPSQKVRSAE